MKAKRILELLEGTKYADRTTTHHKEKNPYTGAITEWDEVAGNVALTQDKYLNAALAQLLAKALRDIISIENELHSGEWDEIERARDVARAALAEAGIESESK